MTFKPGAFLPGKPVQPVLLRYPNQVDTVTWTWNQPHGARSVLWLTLTQPFSKASLEFLPGMVLNIEITIMIPFENRIRISGSHQECVWS